MILLQRGRVAADGPKRTVLTAGQLGRVFDAPLVVDKRRATIMSASMNVRDGTHRFKLSRDELVGGPHMSEMSRRQLLLSLPVLAVARRSLGAQPAAPAAIRVRSLNHFGLAVSDPKRSVDFYQGLFGMPIQARIGATTLLRVGAGPQFISIAPAGSGAPAISHYCLGVDGFDVGKIGGARRALRDEE